MTKVKLTGSRWYDEDHGEGLPVRGCSYPAVYDGSAPGEVRIRVSGYPYFVTIDPEDAAYDWWGGYLIPEETPDQSTFSGRVDAVLAGVGDLLKQKNESYGDAALNPIRVFSKADSGDQLLVRIDDKLSRIARGSEFPGDDTLKDLIGYLVLLLISKEDGES